MGKHFINNRETIVTEALDGLIATSGGRLARLDGYPEIKVVLRADRDPAKVAVVSGGGAGHEPSHAGFVGTGMLTAAVSGEIFASPSVAAVLAGIRAVDRPGGLPADRQELHRRPAELRPRRRARPRRGAEGRDGDRRRRRRAARHAPAARRRRHALRPQDRRPPRRAGRAARRGRRRRPRRRARHPLARRRAHLLRHPRPGRSRRAWATTRPSSASASTASPASRRSTSPTISAIVATMADRLAATLPPAAPTTR